MTYLFINLVVLVIILVILWIAKALVVNRAVLVAMVVIVVLTAIFDSFIIIAGIVAYDTEKLSSIYIGAAPLEDFFYSVAVAIMIPSIWKGLGKYYAKH